MDYQSQTMSVDEMNQRLADLLVEMRKVQNLVELSIDEIDTAFEEAQKNLDEIDQQLDEEYAQLKIIDNDTEVDIEELVLARIEEESVE